MNHPRTAAIIILLLSIGYVTQAQTEQRTTAHILFANARAPQESAQAAVLAPYEKRSRLVQLQPFSTGGQLDVSGEVVFNLFEDVQYTVQLQRKAGTFYDDLEVWTGRVADARFDHLDHYVNTVAVVNPHTHKMVVNIGTDRGYFQILPTAVSGQYRIRDCQDDPVACSLWPAEVNGPGQQLIQQRSVCGSVCATETDAGGRYVVDMFIGYSTLAAAVAGDISAHALSMVETVNTGLNNSLVTSTYMRLVGTGTTPNNPGVVTSVLSDAYTWFAPSIETYAPDYISVFQTLTGAPNEAGGWAGVGGYSSVNNIGQPAAFRHEIGHNVGGGHCPGDGSVLPYAHGYDNGNWRTHLCGNSVNFYSNPHINDNLGQPIGNAATADMARTWQERAPLIATERSHRVPYYTGDPCVNQICLPSHWGGQLEVIKRVVFNTLDNNQADPSWTCATITGYSDFTDLPPTTIARNATYTMTITPNYSYAESKVGVWIDWDNNGILSTTERVANFSGNGPWTQAITVPATAQTTLIRLRIRLQYGASYNPVPCAGSGYSSGETEDYTVQVSTALPITLLDFQGRPTAQGNVLTWQTTDEIKASHFDIERSTNAVDFEKAGQVAARGEAASYAFTDKKTASPTIYYRLKLVDRDAAFQYSKIITIATGQSGNVITVLPNPVSGLLTIRTNPAIEGNMQITCFNVLGQQMFDLPANAGDRTGEFAVDLSALPVGMYTFTIKSAANTTYVTRVLKN